jgi:NADPH:quinone reductase-like Zn-dependent oxidoreductase
LNQADRLGVYDAAGIHRDFAPGLRLSVVDKGGQTMKMLVNGGTGLIGSKTVAILRQGGHEVVAASPKSGVNTIPAKGSRRPSPARRW